MSGERVSRGDVFLLLGRGVWIELLRRQDLYVCGMVMVLFLGGVLLVRLVGVDAPATGTFMLNLGLTLASLAAHIVVLLLAGRQFPDEIENRTLYPLLARPIRRMDIVWSKWLAASCCGIALYVVLAISAWSSVPKLEAYLATTLVQLLVLHGLSLALLAALAMALSLLLPRAPALVLAGACYFGGAALRRLVGTGVPWRWFFAYMPDFGMLDLTTRYTDGVGPLAAGEWGMVLAYALCSIALWAGVAALAFERRRI